MSSIISCANYEVRHHKPLITGIIFPQANGLPVYNPRGKYIIKLYFNGIPRRVTIDHRILVTSTKKPLCTYSVKEGELWPILIEKAFLKVHGGYSYDGGNGGQDTYSITGWIPENVMFKDMPEDEINSRWTRICSAFKLWRRWCVTRSYGDCIITAGTLPLDENCEERLGLVSSHCYCITRVPTSLLSHSVDGGGRGLPSSPDPQPVGQRLVEGRVQLSGPIALDTCADRGGSLVALSRVEAVSGLRPSRDEW